MKEESRKLNKEASRKLNKENFIKKAPLNPILQLFSVTKQ